MAPVLLFSAPISKKVRVRRPKTPLPFCALYPTSVSRVTFFLAGGDPHDLDGCADHVGGALLAFWSAWHQSDFAGDSYTNLPPSLESKKLVNVGLAA